MRHSRTAAGVLIMAATLFAAGCDREARPVEGTDQGERVEAQSVSLRIEGMT